jgi:Lipoprotein confined to pathogenic Mycobacterium
VLCVGCTGTGPSPQEKIIDPQAALAARPTLEEMIARYDQMLARIRDRLDTELGPFTWYEFDPRTSGTCSGDFSHVDGHTTSSPLWVFDDNIPDDQWPHAQRIVADITAEYGFATAGLQIDKPGRHETGGVDTTLDAYYTFGAHLATTLRVSSGCHRSTNPTPWVPSTGTPATP